MRRGKKEDIKSIIREIMQDNAIDAGMRRKYGYLNQNEQFFIYVELKNTKPAVQYVFDLKKPVMIGRSEPENNICIQDIKVSRCQACIWKKDNIVWISDMRATNPTGLKRGLQKVWLTGGNSLPLCTKDIILIGDVKIQVWLYQGEREI